MEKDVSQEKLIAIGSSGHSRSKSKGKGKSNKCCKCKEQGHIKPDCLRSKDKRITIKGEDCFKFGVARSFNNLGDFSHPKGYDIFSQKLSQCKGCKCQ